MLEASSLGARGWLARARATAAPSLGPKAGAHEDPPRPQPSGQESPYVMNAFREQSMAMLQITQLLAAANAGSRDGMTALATASEEAALQKMPGARGAAVREILRRNFESKPGSYAQMVEDNMVRARQGPWVRPDMKASAMEFFAELVPFDPSQVILIYLAFGIARAFDEHTTGQHVQARDTLAKLLVAIEQIARDSGDVRMGWLLTHLPDPPWSRLLKPTQRGAHQDFAMLSSPEWVAAAMAYVKDVSAVAALRTESGSAPKRPASAEDAPQGKRPRVPKKEPKTKAVAK